MAASLVSVTSLGLRSAGTEESDFVPAVYERTEK